MQQILFSGITVDELVEKVAEASTNKILKNLEQLSNKQNAHEEGNRGLTRRETSLVLGVCATTLDKYTKEGLIIKIGVGKRARYFLKDVEAAKVEIMKSLYKRREPQPYQRLRSNKQK